jgi:hypothetical protein
MASGHYPLRRNGGAGAILAKIAGDLDALLKTEGDDMYANIPNCLPSPSDGNTPEDAADDGSCRGKLYLALELIERCLEPLPNGQ